METHLLLQILSYVLFGFFSLFLYLTLINYFIGRHNLIDEKLIKSHIGLCASSTVYTFATFLTVYKISVDVNLKLMHVIWISGSLVTYFYITSIKRFLKDTSNNLNRVKNLPLLSGAGAALYAIYWAMTGQCLFVDTQAPYIFHNNLFLQHVGGFNAGLPIMVLGLLIMIPTIFSAIYFARFILKTPKPDVILLYGIGLMFIATFNDIAISVWDAKYLVPLMFAAHIFEILRITHYNQKSLATKLRETSKDLIETAKLSGVGSNYALLAHEILNPLHAANSYFALLIKRIPKEQISVEMQKYIEQVNKQHLRIEKLAKNVKNDAKVSSQTEFAEVAIAQIVEDSLNTIQMKAYAAGVTINYLSHQSELKIHCLQDQIIQVITNLLSNSIEAIHNLESKWIEINENIDLEKQKVLLTIKDSGHGIPPHFQEKIWEHRFTTKKETGVGIGLNLCTIIVNNHGGTLYLNNKSENTEFVIELPIRKVLG